MAILDQDEIFKLLRQVKPLRQLKTVALQQMAAMVEVRVYQPGETIYRLGQVANNLYIIESGAVDFRELDRLGRPRDVGRLGPIEIFGAQAILQGQVYDRTAIAEDQTTLLVLDRAALNRLLQDHPYIRRPLLREANVRRRWGRVTFPSQGNDEYVLIYARPHWTVLLTKLAFPLAFLGLVIALSGLLAVVLSNEVLGAVVIGLSLVAFALVLLVYSYWDWWFDTYIVTNQRVISMLRRPFLMEQLIEARIGKIQNTGVSFPNLSSRLLGWSDVTIATAGGPPIRFPHIGNGPRVHAVINELVNEAKTRAQVQELQSREAYIESRLRGGGVSGPAQSPSRPTPIVTPDQTPPAIFRFFNYLVPRLREQKGMVITYRKHWIVLLRETWLPLLVFMLVLLVLGGLVLQWVTGLTAPAIGLAPIATILDDSTVSMSLTFIMVALAVGLFFRLLWLYEDWRNDQYVLSESSVMDIERWPLYLREEIKQAGLDNIQDVSYLIPNPVAEFFDYGNILMQTAGQQGRITWDHVENPREVRREINDRIAEAQRKRGDNQQKAVDESLVMWFRAHDRIKGQTP